MTKQRDLKSLIRDRMAKTGESYASARRYIVEKAPTDEKARQSKPTVPKGWLAAGQAPKDYEFTIDRVGARTSAKPSAMLRAIVEKPTAFGTLMQEFVPDQYRDRRVRFSGWVKTKDVANHAKIWMRVDGPARRVLSFGQSSLIEGTTDWQQQHVVLDVADDAAALAFGILLDGAGAAWLDGVVLEIVGKDVPTTETQHLAHAPRNLDFNE